jgi:(E)-4-hydroxy-3-methylbut-2-enyl-diphosphate synthase
MDYRNKTKRLHVGPVPLGGGAKISVQSMCNTKTSDVTATLSQIRQLYGAGCEIIRVAVPDMAAAEALGPICSASPIPVVADIHFDYTLALAAAENGVAKIRINPGNIGGADRVSAVAKACSTRKIPIRIGINSGSLEKDLLEKYGSPTPEAMVESAQRHVDLLNQAGFDDICLSLKASNVQNTVAAYRLAAERFPYPLHLGVTEAGTLYSGVIRSAVGIGTLLCEGIGDTIRVSLTDDPVEEVRAGLAILRSAGLRTGGVNFISCPTCGRTEIDLIRTAKEVEALLSGCTRDITVAVMGCVVNGPGEAREADYGIAGGRGVGVLFKKGQIVGRASEDKLAQALADLILSETSSSTSSEH